MVSMTLEKFLKLFNGDLVSYFNLDLHGPAVSGLMDSGEEGEVAQWHHGTLEEGRWYLLTTRHILDSYEGWDSPVLKSHAKWSVGLATEVVFENLPNDHVELRLADTNEVILRLHPENHADCVVVEGYETKWDKVGVYLEKVAPAEN